MGRRTIHSAAPEKATQHDFAQKLNNSNIKWLLGAGCRGPDHLLIVLGRIWKWRSEESKGHVPHARVLVS